VIIGPGTGLGVAQGHIGPSGQYRVIDGEGGRLTFSAQYRPDLENPDREYDIHRALSQEFGPYISLERVCSGPGLTNLYNAIVKITPGSNLPLDKKPNAISDDAISGECLVCVEALDMFTRALARGAAMHTLGRNALGGVYIGGGIVPKIKDHFDASVFRAEFLANDLGPADFMKNVPVVIITEDDAGLMGAHAHAQRLWKSRSAQRIDREPTSP
jgi:glucokinase